MRTAFGALPAKPALIRRSPARWTWPAIYQYDFRGRLTFTHADADSALSHPHPICRAACTEILRPVDSEAVVSAAVNPSSPSRQRS